MSVWRDKSGNGFKAIASGVQMPTTGGTGTINGLNALQFNGSSNYLLSSGTYAAEMVFVVSERDTGLANSYQGVISVRTSSSQKVPASHSAIGFSNINGNNVSNGSSGEIATGVWIDGIAASTANFNAWPTGVPGWSGTSVGTLTQPALVEIQNSADTAGAQNLLIGADTYSLNPGGGYFKGLVGEVLIYSSTLTTAQRQAVRGVLGLQVARHRWLGQYPARRVARADRRRRDARSERRDADRGLAIGHGRFGRHRGQHRRRGGDPHARPDRFDDLQRPDCRRRHPGAIHLVIGGSGTQILCGTNTYTGGTTINGGTLIATSNEAIEDGTNLYVGKDLSAFGGVVPAQANGAAAAPAVAPVPEPGTLVLLAAAGTLLLLHRRRR